MKKLLIALAAAVLLITAACVSSPTAGTTPTASADVTKIAPFVTSLAQTAVPLVLNKNPAYAPVIASVAAAIPAAFGTGNLDAVSISQAIAIIGGKSGLSSDAQTAISAVLLDAATWYQSTYGVKVASATDPNVQVLLNAFAVGLANGVTLWEKAQPVKA